MIENVVPALPVLTAFTAAALVLTLTPGPDMTLFMSKTLKQGQRAGVAAVLGATSGLIVHTVLAAVGLSALLSASATAFTVLKIAGAGYLLWLAYQALRHGTAFRVDQTGADSESVRRVWLQALWVNILNPKIVLFFVTFLPQFVSASDPYAVYKLLFLGFYFLVLGFPICLAMVFGAGAFAAFLKSSPTIMRLFDWVFAGIMASFAVKLLTARANA
ncbi:LysE family translocator [Roseibium denhamense]|uniref:Threonine/homoserine/homoserine lactone efflux protein n=1 Tax=Roseibium denhamense TaxID=76305 RepID=A0ABY1NQE0_9HYPH|nr:LysE family translocator [Roseibium denhamense]MTI07983.1 LysE family translocator [Roseibium denhamense]SMP15352.1 Threonine/homoserine/homoserine lactone efflux protein [Roseibium denhamense]